MILIMIKFFSFQLESLFDPGDILILISSSGNSKNMVNALKFAKKNKIYTISFTGFKGVLKETQISPFMLSLTLTVSQKTYIIYLCII